MALKEFGNFAAGDLSEFDDITWNGGLAHVSANGQGPNGGRYARLGPADDSNYVGGDTGFVRIHLIGFAGGRPSWFARGKEFWRAISYRVPSGFSNSRNIVTDEIHQDGSGGGGPAPLNLVFTRGGYWRLVIRGSNTTDASFVQWVYGPPFPGDPGPPTRNAQDWAGGNKAVVLDEWVHFRLGWQFATPGDNDGWFEAWARWGSMTDWRNIVPRDYHGTCYPATGHDPYVSLYYPSGAGGVQAVDVAAGAWADNQAELATWQQARLGFSGGGGGGTITGGLYLSLDEIDQIKAKLATDPAVARAWSKLDALATANLTYPSAPPDPDQDFSVNWHPMLYTPGLADGLAAHSLALAALIDNNAAYAAKAKAILLDWVTTYTHPPGIGGGVEPGHMVAEPIGPMIKLFMVADMLATGGYLTLGEQDDISTWAAQWIDRGKNSSDSARDAPWKDDQTGLGGGTLNEAYSGNSPSGQRAMAAWAAALSSPATLEAFLDWNDAHNTSGGHSWGWTDIFDHMIAPGHTAGVCGEGSTADSTISHLGVAVAGETIEGHDRQSLGYGLFAWMDLVIIADLAAHAAHSVDLFAEQSSRGLDIFSVVAFYAPLLQKASAASTGGGEAFYGVGETFKGGTNDATIPPQFRTIWETALNYLPSDDPRYATMLATVTWGGDNQRGDNYDDHIKGYNGVVAGLVPSAGGGGSTPAPVNTVAPAISGTPTEGDTLTTSDGTWDDGTATITYQWQWSEHLAGVWSPVGGATTNSYFCSPTFNGRDIRCQVTATNAGGETIAYSNTVEQTASAVTDNFNRADGALGADWAQPLYTGAGVKTLVISGNKVHKDTGGVGSAYYTGFTQQADCENSIELTDLGAGGGSNYYGISARKQVGADTHYSAFIFGDGTWSVEKMVAGSNDVIASGSGLSLDPSVNGIKIRVVGEEISLWFSAGGPPAPYVLVEDSVVSDSAIPDDGYGGLDFSATQVEADNYDSAAVYRPANTVAPAITGSALIGSTLSVSTGAWNHGPSTYTFQWQRDLQGSGDYHDIDDETGSTYTPVAADDLCNLKVVVTATNAEGSREVTTAVFGPIVALPPVCVQAASILGASIVGSMLTLDRGIWLHMDVPSAVFSQQWQSAVDANSTFVDIEDADGVTFTIPAELEGHVFRAIVYAANSGVSE